MKILALDLATATGVAFGDSGDRAPQISSESLGEAGRQHGARFAQALRVTKKLIKTHRPKMVIIEEPIVTGVVGSKARVQLAFGYRSMVAVMCNLEGVQFREANVSSVREYFIGAGNLRRDEAKRRVWERCHALGWRCKNDNESDAAAVWDYARAKYCGCGAMPANGLF